jgi:DNA-binding PadR family transcriptional regulator
MFPQFHTHFGRRAVRGEASPERHGPRHEHGPRGGRARGREHGREHGGERGRMFDHGDVRPVIMALLEEAPRHGYDIIKALEERVGGGYSPSPGVIYPTLTLLEELGHAAVAEAHGGRKLYTLSDAGLAYLNANRATAEAILARVSQTVAERRGPPAPVVRALENLHTAVRLRLKGQPVSDAQVAAVAAAIDAAAASVEKV